MVSVWRHLLEESEHQAKARLAAVDVYGERVAEPLKAEKAGKQLCAKKVAHCYPIHTNQPQSTQVNHIISNGCLLRLTVSVSHGKVLHCYSMNANRPYCFK